MSEQNSIKIATLNLLNFAAPPYRFYSEFEGYSQSQWQSKTLFISELIAHMSPTVIAFQEVFSVKELEDICKEQGLPYFSAVSNVKHESLKPDVLYSPIVAIASKYPIESLTCLLPNQDLLDYFGHNAPFAFNRTPIKCKINLPSLGYVSFYVLHLKSQRLVTDGNLFEQTNAEPTLRHYYEQSFALLRNSQDRSLEASIIMHDVMTNNQDLPVIVLGDFNHNLEHASLLPFNIPNDHSFKDMPSEVGLIDSFKISQMAMQGQTKPPTHFYRGKGNVLDYILLSQHFDPLRENCVVNRLNYATFDGHLSTQRDGEDIRYSDHAAIMIELAV
jgi:endonuclease/exonuclease/phosphatase family metal-dependent hydrolase